MQQPDDSERFLPIEHPGLPAGFCVAPWVQMHVATNGNAAPCCEYAGTVGSVREKTVADIWSGEGMQDVRQRFLAGKKLKECWKCFEHERSNLRSMRAVMNHTFADHLDAIVEIGGRDAPSSMPVAFDIRFTNLCNLRCRTCWHGSSSKWFSDAKKLGSQQGDAAEIRSFDNVEAMMEQLAPALPLLEELYFAGGEPLLMEEHYILLRTLVERGQTHVKLRYNTNLSVTRFKGSSILDLWNKFEHVAVKASIDAAGSRGELIRKDLDWEGFVANVQALSKECPRVDFGYETTVSALNVLDLPDLFQELINRCEASPKQFSMHVLQEPGHYRVHVLPRALRKKAARQLASFVAGLRRGPYQADELTQFEERVARLRAHILDDGAEFREPAAIPEKRRCARQAARRKQREDAPKPGAGPVATVAAADMAGRRR